jgi:LysM repeat protein
MRRTHWLFPLLIAGFVMLTALRPSVDAAVVVQNDALCQRLVTEALANAAASCANLGRNQACYGNASVEAELNPNFDVRFSQAGDKTMLASLARIVTAPFNSSTGEWGIALLRAQANLPDALPGQNVTFLLFGDTSLTNPTADMRAVRLSTSLTEDINCEETPPSGLLVQASRGTQVTLTLNGADIILGSTAYITAEFPEMRVATADGVVVVSALGFIRVVQPGEQVFLPLDEEGGVIGGPSEVEPLDCDEISRTPLFLLPEDVELLTCAGSATPLPAAPTATPTRSASAASATPTTRPVSNATVTPSAACTPRPDWTYIYIIQPGDTLSGIGRRIGLSPFTLAAGNCIANPNIIFVGQRLRSPVPVPPPPPATPTVTPTVTPTATSPVTPTSADSQSKIIVAMPMLGS